jgi:hypothetical protein
MATRGTIETALADELASVLTDATSVTSPNAHVDRVRAHDGATYPFVGLELTNVVPKSGGVGNGQEYVHDRLTNADGNVSDLVVRRDVRMNVDLLTIATDETRATSQSLGVTLHDRLATLSDDPSLLHDDIDLLRVTGGGDASRDDDRVYGDRVPVEIHYYRERTTSVQPLEQIHLSIDVE